MPPVTEPQVVGWLLLFIPGFVFLAVLAYFGPSARGRSQLAWIAYSILLSLLIEIVARLTVDHIAGSQLDPVSHPVRRAAVLLALGSVGALLFAWIANRNLLYTLRWRLLGESVEPRVWTAFFRNPDAQDYVRVELTDGRAFVGHVDMFSVDVNDPPRELVLTDLRLEKDGDWVRFPGAIYIDSSQIRMVARVASPNDLVAVTQALTSGP